MRNWRRSAPALRWTINATQFTQRSRSATAIANVPGRGLAAVNSWPAFARPTSVKNLLRVVATEINVRVHPDHHQWTRRSQFDHHLRNVDIREIAPGSFVCRQQARSKGDRRSLIGPAQTNSARPAPNARRLWGLRCINSCRDGIGQYHCRTRLFSGNENEICRAVNCALRVLRTRDRTNQRMSIDCKGQRSPRLLRSGRAAHQPQQARCNAPNVLASARPTGGCSGRGECPVGRQDKQHLPWLLSRCRSRRRTSASRRLVGARTLPASINRHMADVSRQV
jgi:hypothetical protein